MLLGVSCGGVWVKRDEGASWALRADDMRAAYMPPEGEGDPNIQDPHRIVRCPFAPGVLWAQYHNGIWRSGDNAQSWQELAAPRSTFGFAVAVHPADPDRAWFVPGQADQCRIPPDAALAVHMTSDGGRSFEAVRGRAAAAACV